MSAMIAFLSLIVSRCVMAFDTIHGMFFISHSPPWFKTKPLYFGDSHHNLEISAWRNIDASVTVTETM
jgi:hypothetical protein